MLFASFRSGGKILQLSGVYCGAQGCLRVDSLRVNPQ